MSLATRCNACGTLFRVVQDQLRVSEGWVRCGRCDVVFNAHDSLVDLEAEAQAAEAEEADAVAAAAIEAEAAEAARLHHAAAATAPAPVPAAPIRRSVNEPAPAWQDDETPVARPFSPQTSSAAARAPFSAAEALVEDPPEMAPAEVWEPPSVAEPAPSLAKPRFVQDAERSARWNSPAMRAALLGLSLMLLVVLAGQAAFHFRDALAARSPAAASVLTAACARWGCRIEPLRRIEHVTLEGSGLSRIAQQPQAIKLSISLRNRGSTDLALPSIDLSLSDANGKLIARRALSPKDFKVDSPLIARGAELPLELVLSTGDQPVSAYTVELFYP